MLIPRRVRPQAGATRPFQRRQGGTTVTFGEWGIQA